MLPLEIFIIVPLHLNMDEYPLFAPIIKKYLNQFICEPFADLTIPYYFLKFFIQKFITFLKVNFFINSWEKEG